MVSIPALKICGHRNCGNTQPCPDHPKEPWAGSNRTRRLRTSSGSRQQKLRRFVLYRDDNRCHVCGKQYPDAQLINDHVIPLFEGGDDDVENMGPCCTGPGTDRCHDIKTQAEAQRARTG